jgi:homocitrate synthase NifV
MKYNNRLEITNSIRLIDSTLRDGEQAPGVVFTVPEKLHIASMLDETGIDEIEAGAPAMGDEVCDVIRRIVAMKLNARISVWSRALTQDILAASKTGAQGIHIAFPLSDIQLSSMNKTWEMMKDCLPQIVEMAKKYFPYVSIGAQDAGRCGTERLLEFAGIANKANIDRIRIADTVGILTPVGTMRLMGEILNSYPGMEIDFHGHNDLGMATANAVTAWQSGATNLSATVNGLGERAGNAALEEVIMAIELTGNQSKYDTSTLYSLCKYVALASGRRIPEGKPVCGSMVFSHESGIHAKCSAVDICSFQAFDGKLVGRESSRNVFGTHSGKGAVIDFLSKQNIETDNIKIDELVSEIRHKSRKYKRNVHPAEILLSLQPKLN